MKGLLEKTTSSSYNQASSNSIFPALVPCYSLALYNFLALASTSGLAAFVLASKILMSFLAKYPDRIKLFYLYAKVMAERKVKTQ